MKKNLFFFAAAAIALASCSNDDVVDVNNGSGISFRASVDSRASWADFPEGNSLEQSNFEDFYVTAYNSTTKEEYFAIDRFIKNNEGAFESTHTYYWPDTDPLDFYAYNLDVAVYTPGVFDGDNAFYSNLTIGDNENKIIVDNANKALKMTNFVTYPFTDYQTDLAVAYAQGSKAANETNGVELNFKHIFSQIKILAKNTNKSYTYKVKGIRLGNVKAIGDMEYKEGTVTWKNMTSDVYNFGYIYDTPYTLTETATQIMNHNSIKSHDNQGLQAMVIPQKNSAWDKDNTSSTGSYIGVLVQVLSDKNKQVFPNTEGKYAWVAVPVQIDWKNNIQYVYTLDFSYGGGSAAPEQGGAGGDNTGGGDAGGNSDDVIGDGDDDDKDIIENPGKPILGGPIKFTVKLESWKSQNKNEEMK